MSSFLKDKRAQGKLILLILAIGVFIVAYLVALPVSERCKYLPDLPECKPSYAAVSLLNVSPGLMVPQEFADYSLQPIELFSYESLNFPLRVLPQTIKRSWFSETSIEQNFTLHQKLKEAKVFVPVTKSSGSLEIFVNGQKIKTIYEKGYYLASIPRNILNKTNTLKVSASTPWLPVLVNSFEVDSIIVKEVYFITHDTVSKSISIAQNISDINLAIISFNAECFYQDNLKVILNNQLIENKAICDRHAVNVTSFLQKENNLTFSSSGNYLISDIELRISTKEKQYPIYYFNIDSENVDNVRDGINNAALYVYFSDLERKQFDVYLNGFKIPIDTSLPMYRTIVNSYIHSGQNVIFIIPKA